MVARRWMTFLCVVGIALICGSAGAQPHGTVARTADMLVAREFHTATLLDDGRVLIAGGGTRTAEVYDPSTGTFAFTGSMSVSRELHSATLLGDGRVLIAGGRQSGTAEIYDPATGQFTPTGEMRVHQYGHSAVLLKNGKVFVTGGIGVASRVPGAEITALYDPASGEFVSAGPSEAASAVWPAVAVLRDGSVLISGKNPSATYDPDAEQFVRTGALASSEYRFGVFWHSATPLNDGTVLIAGGNDDWVCGGFFNAELYDPGSRTFRPIAPMMARRDLHTATLLRDGTVLLAGGGSSGCGIPTNDTAELYDPARGTFGGLLRLVEPRAGHTATLLRDGTVLLTGGFSYYPHKTLRSAEVYKPAQLQARPRSVRR